MDKTVTTKKKLKTLIHSLADVMDLHDKRVAKKKEVMGRLIWIFNEDTELAKTVYNYVWMGHLSYYNQLRTRFKDAK